MRNVAIRVDASTEIGSGHFMRSLTLANALKKEGRRCRFICRHLSGHLRDLARGYGHEVAFLRLRRRGAVDDLPHSHWLGCKQELDAQDSVAALADGEWDWLIVDHYSLDVRWESEVQRPATKTLVIDDLADRQHNADMLLDQNLHSDMPRRYEGKVPPSCELLLGPRYALLRDEFRALRDAVRTRSGPIGRVLILMGGFDALNDTGKAIAAVARIRPRNFEVDVVIGAEHPARQAIAADCKRHNFSLHVQTTEVAGLMAAADICIGSCGSSSWERCSLGLPSICVIQGANQAVLAQALQERGAIINLGDSSDVTSQAIADVLVSIGADLGKLASMSRASAALVDGEGTRRVCRRMVRAS